jgi:hypothetical protein
LYKHSYINEKIIVFLHERFLCICLCVVIFVFLNESECFLLFMCVCCGYMYEYVSIVGLYTLLSVVSFLRVLGSFRLVQGVHDRVLETL